MPEQTVEPPGLEVDVGVDEGDDRRLGGAGAGVACRRRSGVVAQADQRRPAHAGQRGAGAVVDEHHAGRVEAVAEDVVEAGRWRLVGRHDDRDVGWLEPLAVARPEGWAGGVDRPGVEEPLGEPGRCHRSAGGDLVEQFAGRRR